MLLFHTFGIQQTMNMMELLEQLDFERNRLTRVYVHSPFPQQNAMDSQALLELWQHYCLPKRCLECALGERIVCQIHA